MQPTRPNAHARTHAHIDQRRLVRLLAVAARVGGTHILPLLDLALVHPHHERFDAGLERDRLHGGPVQVLARHAAHHASGEDPRDRAKDQGQHARRVGCGQPQQVVQQDVGVDLGVVHRELAHLVERDAREVAVLVEVRQKLVFVFVVVHHDLLDLLRRLGVEVIEMSGVHVHREGRATPPVEEGVEVGHDAVGGVEPLVEQLAVLDERHGDRHDLATLRDVARKAGQALIPRREHVVEGLVALACGELLAVVDVLLSHIVVVDAGALGREEEHHVGVRVVELVYPLLDTRLVALERAVDERVLVNEVAVPANEGQILHQPLAHEAHPDPSA
mmetsp:Transcript_87879/g.250484  ORF Transcript_87879/g.250484 Transcript_87879/m.250484 type:complete len:332 (+) Transcript_87879:1178-2173(+)